MSPRTVLLITLFIVVSTALPTLYVFLREILRRRRSKRAISELEAAKAVITGDTSLLTTAERDARIKELRERFDPLTVERAVEALIADTDPARRTLGRTVFDALGFFEIYTTRLRVAKAWSARAHAAGVLGHLAVPSAVPALVACLRDPHEDAATVKIAAANALAAIHDDSAIPLLVEQLREIDEWSSPRVAEALITFGKPAVGPLIEMLDGQTPAAARVWAARVLGRIGDKEAVDVLMGRLHERHDLLRVAAAQALGLIGDPRALRPLMQASLRDPAPQVRAHAAAALTKVGGEKAIDVFVAALSDPDYGTRLRALEALESVELTDTSVLEIGLRDQNLEVRRRAALALERVGHLARVVERLASDDYNDAKNAYLALLELGRAGLIDSVAGHLHHARFEVRAYVAMACGELGAARTGALLLAALDDPAWPVRARLAEAIGLLKPEGATEALAKLLVDPEAPVAEAASEALTRFGAKDLEPIYEVHIIPAYDRGSVIVRSQVLALANRFERKETTALLIRAVDDPSERVREMAVRAFEGRSAEAPIALLAGRLMDTSLQVRVAAVAALGSDVSTESFEMLLRALPGASIELRERITSALARDARRLVWLKAAEMVSSDNADVRLGLAWTLGKVGDPEGVGYLRELLTDGVSVVRASAAGALGKIPGTETTKVLLAGVADRDARTRAAVVNALGKVGSSSRATLAALRGRLIDPDAFVRDRAVLALGRLGDVDLENALADARVRGFVSDIPSRIALVLSGSTKAVGSAIDALANETERRALTEFLAREEPALRRAFYGKVGLDDGHGAVPTDLEPPGLVAHYEQTLHTSADVAARQVAVEALTRLGGASSGQVLADVVRSDPSAPVRLAAANALAGSDFDVANGALLGAVSDPSEDVALVALRAVHARRLPGTRDALLRRLGSGSPELRAVLEGIVAELYQSDGMAFLDWMMGIEDTATIVACVNVLARLADASHVPLLVELGRTRDAHVRSAVVKAVAQFPDGDARDAVDDALLDPDEIVRETAVVALLGSRHDRSYVRAEAAIRDPSTRVRRALATLLGGAATPAVLPLLILLAEDLDAVVSGTALASLLTIGNAAFELYRSAYERASTDARYHLRRDARVPAICAGLALVVGASRIEADRRTAVETVAALAPEGYAKLLVGALRDPSARVREAAILALAPVDDADVRKRIAELLGDPDRNVREAAKRSHLRVVS